MASLDRLLLATEGDQDPGLGAEQLCAQRLGGVGRHERQRLVDRAEHVDVGVDHQADVASA